LGRKTNGWIDFLKGENLWTKFYFILFLKKKKKNQ